jgi:dihydrodipicolinate synthase/N-acetylneuraminate lyase
MGAKCVMLLPPTAYRANDEEIIAHYKEVSKVGLPVFQMHYLKNLLNFITFV